MVNYKNFFKFNKNVLSKHNWFIQALITLTLVWIYLNSAIKLHPIIAIFSILFCYILQCYIENKILIKHLNEKLTDLEKIVNIMCNLSSNFITYKDHSGKYIYGNKAFLNAINKTLPEIKGKKEIDLFPQKDAFALNSISKKVLQGKVVKKILKMDYNDRIYDISSEPLSLTSSVYGIAGICCVAKDITSEKTAIEQRETYAATLTHDLKTPTIAQIKALDLILNNHMGPLTKEQRELLILTKDSCNYMYDMLSTLLSTYKYENGDFVLNYENCNLLSLVEDSSNEIKSMLKEKNIKIITSKKGHSFDLSCDKIQIKMVVINLLKNAISYAYNNTDIMINLEEKNGNIIFNVTNKSLYINPALLENLFKKYASDAAKYNKIGVGLGLYLSKQIIEAHNGHIYAEGYKDNHNVFGFSIPVKKFQQTIKCVAS